MENWLKLVFSKKQHPMSDEMTKVLMSLMMNKDSSPGLEIEGIFLYQLIEKRAKVMFKKVTWQAVAFLTYLSGKPGTAVMYLAAIQSKYDELTTDSIAFSFPHGFLSDEDLNELWGAQKVKGQNLLDMELRHV